MKTGQLTSPSPPPWSLKVQRIYKSSSFMELELFMIPEKLDVADK